MWELFHDEFQVFKFYELYIIWFPVQENSMRLVDILLVDIQPHNTPFMLPLKGQSTCILIVLIQYLCITQMFIVMKLLCLADWDMFACILRLFIWQFYFAHLCICISTSKCICMPVYASSWMKRQSFCANYSSRMLNIFCSPSPLPHKKESANNIKK